MVEQEFLGIQQGPEKVLVQDLLTLLLGFACRFRKGATVRSTTHSVPVLPPRAGAKKEPVAPNLVGSLVHPDREASFKTIRFSPDGRRVFTAGYPSGIVQIWDVAGMKEVRRIDTPPGLRAFANYALLTPDWKTLYVPVEKRTVKPYERDGKKLNRIEHGGEIRIWDVISGKEKEPLRPASGSSPAIAGLSPTGRYLVCAERPSCEAGDTTVKDAVVAWDLASGRKWKLTDDAYPSLFGPDEKTVVANHRDFSAKTSVVKVIELGTGKELVSRTCLDKERYFSLGPIAPDGSVVAVSVGGVKGAPLEIWFLDARTLEERGKLIGKGDSDQYWGGRGVFTPDSKQFIAVDAVGNVLFWDVAGQRLVGTQGGLDLGHGFRELSVSPNGKTLAVGWAPKGDPELEEDNEVDPRDLPQPRVSLIDLGGKTSPRTLVAPHGYVGGLAFSPDGKTFAFGGAGAVHLFDLRK
jgi:WD40 repeat protein